ncbi:MAG: hypothetical protein LBV13_05355 [Methanomassiliicoccaceae archaeon]|jgi:hypothetical protein|nr:hypothetical protein [Methanomassiliicoccaceae archaeon]
MVAVNEKVLIAVAVVAAATLCIAGMYLIEKSGDREQDVHVILPYGLTDHEYQAFADFEKHTKAVVHITVDEAPVVPFAKDTVIITMSLYEGESGIDRTELEINSRIYYAYSNADAPEMVGNLINWLEQIFRPGPLV